MGPKVVHNAEVPGRGGQGALFLWGFSREAATAQRGSFWLVGPLRGSTFFFFAHSATEVSIPGGQEGLRQDGRELPGALTCLLVLGPTYCACDDHSLLTLPLRACTDPVLVGQLRDNRDPVWCLALCRCPGNEQAGGVSELWVWPAVGAFLTPSAMHGVCSRRVDRVHCADVE